MTPPAPSMPVDMEQAADPPTLQGMPGGHAAESHRTDAFSPASSRSLPLRPERIFWQALGIVALLLLNLGRDAGAAVFFLILIFMTFRGPAGAYKALAICYMGLMINFAFVPKTLAWTPGRLILPPLALMVFVSSVGKSRVRLFWTPTNLSLLLYVLTMAVCSILSGWYTHIALLKLFNFWVFVTAVLSGMTVLRAKNVDMTEWFVALIVAAETFGLGSILLGQGRNFQRMPGASEMLTAELFNGAFLHPNCHSLYASMFVLFLAICYVLGQYRNRWVALPLIGIWIYFMILSKARTSIVATLIPFLILVVYAGPWRDRFGQRLRSNVSRAQLMAAAAACLVMIAGADLVSGGKVSKAIFQFINKSKAEEMAGSLDTKQILNSRQAMIDFSWSNFQKSPVYGIGFQVAKTEYFVRNATLFTAPAEKGFLPTAVLEEGGILGATTFVLFLLCLVAEWVRTRNVAAIVLFTGFLVSSFSEVTIFSPGGSGGFGWVMVGAGAILSDHCWRRSLAQPRRRSLPIGPLFPMDMQPQPATFRGG